MLEEGLWSVCERERDHLDGGHVLRTTTSDTAAAIKIAFVLCAEFGHVREYQLRIHFSIFAQFLKDYVKYFTGLTIKYLQY